MLARYEAHSPAQLLRGEEPMSAHLDPYEYKGNDFSPLPLAPHPPSHTHTPCGRKQHCEILLSCCAALQHFVVRECIDSGIDGEPF